MSKKGQFISKKIHEIISHMCQNPGRSFNKEEHSAPLYNILPSSKIPKEVAALFVEATTFTAAFTGVRTTESMKALKKLCKIKGAIVDNMLHCIAKMSDTEQTIQKFDMTGMIGSGSQTTEVSFEPQRILALTELKKRGSPKYDIKHYADN